MNRSKHEECLKRFKLEELANINLPYQLGVATVTPTKDKENSFDIYSCLLAERIIF